MFSLYEFLKAVFFMFFSKKTLKEQFCEAINGDP